MEQDKYGNEQADTSDPLHVAVPGDLLPRILASLGLSATPVVATDVLERAQLVADLKSPLWDGRVAALQSLGKLTTPPTFAEVVDALSDENAFVRAAACRVLRRVSGNATFDPLVLALNDSEWSVRAAAAQTLGLVGGQVAVEPLLHAMQSDTDESVRATAAQALGQIKERVPLEPLLDALHDPGWLVREAALATLGRLDQPLPLEALLAASEDVDLSVRLSAQSLLPRFLLTTSTEPPVSEPQPLPTLPVQEARSNQRDARRLALSAGIKRWLAGDQSAMTFDGERETIQYLPLPPAVGGRSSGRLRPLLAAGSIVAAVLIVAGFILASIALFRLPHNTASQLSMPTSCPAGVLNAPSSGCAFFKSSNVSDQSSQTTDKGINDILEIDLSHVSSPAAGQSYYAWLLVSLANPEGPALLLARLSVQQGTIHYIYRDPQQTDLLALSNALLITEQSTQSQPLVPSIDRATWRYSGVLSQTPDPNDTTHHYSLVDHLHHLLTSDPELENVHLSGGLAFWLHLNVQALTHLVSAAQNARVRGDVQGTRSSLVGILDYLDSAVYVSRDVPPGTPLAIDPAVARVAILTFDSLNQVPSGYIQHIAFHLAAIAASPYATSGQRALAARLNTDLSLLETRFQEIRQLAKNLLALNDSQLLQPAASQQFQTLSSQISQAYLGQFNPTTHTLEQSGISQIYNNIQTLATFSLGAYKS